MTKFNAHPTKCLKNLNFIPDSVPACAFVRDLKCALFHHQHTKLTYTCSFIWL